MHWRNILGSALELHPMGLPQSYKVGDETTIEAFAKISCAFRQVAAARTCVNICRSEWRNGCMQDEARPAVQQDAERQRILEQDYNGMHTIIDSIPVRFLIIQSRSQYSINYSRESIHAIMKVIISSIVKQRNMSLLRFYTVRSP